MNSPPSAFRVPASGLNLSMGRSALRAARFSSRCGATLLVTLGVLSVLSVLVVTFLLTSRHQNLAAKHFSDKVLARQTLSFAIAEAMKAVDDAMVASNYIYRADSVLPDSEKSRRRVSPVKLWRAITVPAKYASHPNQTANIYLSPIPGNTTAATNDLLSAEIKRFLPAALSRWAASENTPLQAGWTNFTADTRASFAIFDCSGFIDAHCYATTNALIVTTQHVERAYFSQQDLINDTHNERVQEFVNDATASSPFFISSYDPGPDVMPLDPDQVQPAASLGTLSFRPPAKFNINSITNHFLSEDTLGVKRRLAVMPSSWFHTVSRLLQSASVPDINNVSSSDGRDAFFGDPKKVAWNIVNYMTESRIPTAFSENALEAGSAHTASRLDYAIEAVPLINEVELKDIFDGSETKDSFSAANQTLYGSQLSQLDSQLRALFASSEGGNTRTVEIHWSNIYAFDVELWYPFKPVPAPEKAHLWLSATTNSPALFTSAQSPYAWLNDEFETLGFVLFSRWNDLYGSTTNGNIVATNDVVWQAIQTNAVLQTYVLHPNLFDDASNQLAIAESFSELWSAAYLSGSTQAPTNQPYTKILLDTTTAYTNRITQAVLSDNMPGVNTVLHTPFSGAVDWGDANAWARYFQEQFKASASQFSEYSKYDIPPEKFAESEYLVVNHTNQLVYLPYVETNRDDAAKTETVVIRFKPLSSDNDALHAWLRPMVTVSEIDLSVLTGVEGIPETADEALLIRNGTKDTGYYKRWDKTGSISIDDPRDNAWSDRWSEQTASMGKKNDNCNVAEYPFIHYDRPFLSIGELGYINVDLSNRLDAVYDRLPHPAGPSFKHDTVDFATRSGAALLDKFCIGGVSNTVVRGLVQANTSHGEVIRRVLNQIATGWPTDTDGQANGDRFQLGNAATEAWIAHWTNTLLRAYGAGSSDAEFQYSGLSGWTSFADMLPDLSTNALSQNVGPLPAKAELTDSPESSVYDYLEDVMRGIVDKVSFRQNIFVVIVAAQTLSPLSTEQNPVVLADQRAAVTVIRDAFTGRWSIFNWTWLTE